MILIPENIRDSKYLNARICEHLGEQHFTPQQEIAIKNLIEDISSGYNHTISRQEWGLGWD